jgi:hypothetical protein
VHVGDVGTVFEVTVKEGSTVVDISTATVKSFVCRKPSGAVVTWTAEFATNGTDGKLRYTTAEDDLDRAGDWRMQAYIEMPTGAWHSDEATFKVAANFA